MKFKIKEELKIIKTSIIIFTAMYLGMHLMIRLLVAGCISIGLL